MTTRKQTSAPGANYWIPEGLDLGSLLSSKLNKTLKPIHADKYNFILDTVYRKRIRDDLKPADYVPLNSRVLQAVLTPDFAAPVRCDLAALGILEEDPSYQSGAYSKSYRFTDAYRRGRFVKVPALDPKQTARIRKHFEKERLACTSKHPGRALIDRSIQELTVDFSSAERYIQNQVFENEDKRKRHEFTLDEFRSRHFRYSVDRWGRNHHLLTSCPRGLRQFLSWKGKAIHGVDVVNCQPLLLVSLYDTETYVSDKQTKLAEKKRLEEICSKGKFYEFINDRLNPKYDLRNPGERPKLKERVFKEYLYNRLGSRNSTLVWEIMATEFPVLHDSMFWTKVGNYRDVARNLQSTEAEIVIDGAAKEFAERHTKDDVCVISIHDCLLTTEDRLGEVEGLLVEHFQSRLGVRPSIKRALVSDLGEDAVWT